MKIIKILLVSAAFAPLLSFSQAPFEILLEPVSIENLGGIQSFAHGQYDGKWVLIGGRLDGLHRRQPWASFDQAGHNTDIIVVDPVALEKWSASLSSLPAGISAQLSSTNMEFYQTGDYLYIIGGYGYSPQQGDHITHPNITAVNVPELINSVVNGTDLTPWFRQYTVDDFAVTGGYLEKIGDLYYLIGGQRFDGVYNPMNNPTFTQAYTNAVRRFNIEDDGENLSVNFVDVWVDADAFHRRDYNAAPQIMPDGSQGITAFSGVFQPNADLPWLNAVNITSDGYAFQDGFSQYYNHYHCAQAHMYDADANEMHTVFFGGIAQYFDNDGVLTQDDNVPFVKTIARVTRTADGSMAEYKLPIEMPALLGAGAEFIPVQDIPTYANGVAMLNELEGDTILIGYIFGGIESSAPNIFWVNNGTQSTAFDSFFKVFIIKQTTTSIDLLNPQSTNSLAMQVYPNPGSDLINVTFHLLNPESTTISLTDMGGKLVLKETYPASALRAGENQIQLKLNMVGGAGVYFLNISNATNRGSLKVVLNK